MRKKTEKRISVSLILGTITGSVLGGLALFTFIYAGGHSYLSDDSKVCTNCHVMQEQYTGWITGLHRKAASCNECHMPANFIGKYFTKFRDGLGHSFAFTSGHYNEPIRIKERSRKTVENSCLRCHQSIFYTTVKAHEDERIACTGCHHDVGH